MALVDSVLNIFNILGSFIKVIYLEIYSFNTDIYTKLDTLFIDIHN